MTDSREELVNILEEVQQHTSRWPRDWVNLFDDWTNRLVADAELLAVDFSALHARIVNHLNMTAQSGTPAESSLLKFLNQYKTHDIPPMSLVYKFLDLLTKNVNAKIKLAETHSEESLEKQAATYDSKETDAIMTKQLAERDDYGIGVFPHHDYPENSSDVRPWSPSRHQQELWNRFREWWGKTWKKQKEHDEEGKIGREKGKNSPSRGEQVGNQGEGFWAYKNTPYVAPTQSPAFFNAMPAMKIGKMDQTGLTLEDLKKHFVEKLGNVYKEAIDQYDDHHVSLTFEFMLDEVRVECTWDTKDLPQGLSEVEALSRVLKFLESRLPPTFLKFKQAHVEDLDLPNRTITMIIPKGEK